MTLELSAVLDARKLNRQLADIKKNALPKVQSKALQQAAEHGANRAIATGQTALDDPIPAVFQKKRSKNRRGWIWFEWDKGADIKRKSSGNAMVQVQGLANTAVAREQQREAIHRQVFGTTETSGVTPKIPYIIRPSRKLLRRKKIKGVPYIKIDAFGNIRNYRDNMRKAMADERFFNVPLSGGTGTGGRNGNGLQLRPGLYFRKLAARKYKRHKVTKRKGGPYGLGPQRRKKQTVGLMTILTYHSIRDYKKKWEFHKHTRTAMRRRYNEAFLIELTRAISRQRVGLPDGPVRRTGSLI